MFKEFLTPKTLVIFCMLSWLSYLGVHWGCLKTQHLLIERQNQHVLSVKAQHMRRLWQGMKKSGLLDGCPKEPRDLLEPVKGLMKKHAITPQDMVMTHSARKRMYQSYADVFHLSCTYHSILDTDIWLFLEDLKTLPGYIQLNSLGMARKSQHIFGTLSLSFYFVDAKNLSPLSWLPWLEKNIL